MTLLQLVAQLRELEKKVTPGPWNFGCDMQGIGEVRSIANEANTFVGGSIFNIHDAQLIAAVRNKLPKILNALEEALLILDHRDLIMNNDHDLEEFKMRKEWLFGDIK